MKTLVYALFLSVPLAGIMLAAGDAAAGKAVYTKSCQSCHGPDGTPKEAIAKSLKVEMLHLGDPAVQKLSDDELKKIVTDGKGKMKGIKSVTGDSVDNVVAYMRTLKK